jgi:hypothetical protein
MIKSPWIITASRLLPVLMLAAVPPPARAQTSYPMLGRIEPTALQRGKTAEVTISGSGTGNLTNFAGAWQMICEGPGLSGEVTVPATDAPAQGTKVQKTAVKARLTAEADAPLGPREIRVATPQGASSVGLVVLVDSPVATEADDRANDQPAQAQVLSLPVTVSGAIGKTEDVDWYAVEAAAGQRVTFRLWGNRLENKIHDLQMHFDPILILHDAQGRELAADDNHDFADPMLSFEFPAAGHYLLEVRDTSYGGQTNWTYVLEATGGPYVTSVFPLAVNPGGTASLRAEGFNFDPAQTITLAVPETAPRGPWLTALPTAQGPTLALPLVVTPLPLAREEGDAAAEFTSAQSLAMPTALSGGLGAPGDGDVYRFEGKKGQIYAFEVIARRAGTAIDAVLRVVNDKGAALAEADDTFGKDPRLEWTAPADGPYAVQIVDLHSRGGPNFGYVLEAEAARPDFVLTCDPDKINVGPGGRVPVFVQVTRRGGFGSPVALEWEGLPGGVESSALTIPANMAQGVLVVSAAADAAPAAALLTLRGKAETPEGPVVRKVTPKQEIYLPGGGRGFYAVNTQALAVTDPSDITIEASPETIRLTPGGKATIDVTVTRRKDFEKPVNLAVILQHLGGVHGNPLPPGVTVAAAGNKTLLGPKETAGKIVLQAAPGAAPCENVPIAVMGHVSINFVVKTAYASKPILISVQGK